MYYVYVSKTPKTEEYTRINIHTHVYVLELRVGTNSNVERISLPFSYFAMVVIASTDRVLSHSALYIHTYALFGFYEVAIVTYLKGHILRYILTITTGARARARV